MQLQQRITTGGTGDGRFALQKSMSAHVSHGSRATKLTLSTTRPLLP
jgi:hypothetical protein